jgi:hypothetical protein
MKILIDRYSPEKNQIIGKLYLLDNNNSVIDSWDSLELPWLDNQKYISCIPKGSYKAKKHNSPKFGECLWIQDVPGRSEILIHKGNYYTDILGCVLIGTGLGYINKDGIVDVTNSKVAVGELLSYLKEVDGIMIEIK